MGSVTVASMRSVGSPLDLRIRREARKSRALLRSAKISLFDTEQNQDIEPMPTKEMNPEPKSEEENIQDLANWLKCMASFDSFGRSIEQVIGIKVGVLPSAVSKNAERFDQMNVVDDEFYTYTGKTCFFIKK